MISKIRKFNSAIRELKKYIKQKFKDQKYCLVVWGSIPYGKETENSDFDYFVIVEKAKKRYYRELKNFTMRLYKKKGIHIDDNPYHDVSYDKKLLFELNFVEKAIEGYGFERKKNKLFIPEVKCTPQFLNSDKFCSRLLYNALTSKNKYIAGDKRMYNELKVKALENLVRHIQELNDNSLKNVGEVVEALIGNKYRREGSYLGYKNRPEVRKYLKNALKKYV